MTQMWKFSESNHNLLRRCVEVGQGNGTNIWMEKFGHNTEKLLDAHNLSDLKKEINTLVISDDSDTDTSTTSTLVLDQVLSDDDIETNQFSQDITVAEPITHIDYMMKKCMQDPRNYDLIATKMTELDIKKLLDHILNSKLDATFTKKILETLLPIYLKKETSRSSVEILVNMRKHNIFNYLLPIIFNNTDIQSDIMQEYTSILDNSEKSELINNIISMGISNEVFFHHINLMRMIYQDCEKSKEINAFILSNLIQAAQNGSTDKIYGRLLHLYLLHQRNNPMEASASIDTLGDLINGHHSTFRKPCMNVFNDIKNQMDVT